MLAVLEGGAIWQSEAGHWSPGAMDVVVPVLPARHELRQPPGALDTYDAVWSRSLFSARRGNAVEAVVEPKPAKETPPMVAAVTPEFRYHLVGIASEGGKFFALLSSPAQQQTSLILAREGDQINGWRVKGIDAAEVVIEAVGERRTLALRPPPSGQARGVARVNKLVQDN